MQLALPDHKRYILHDWNESKYHEIANKYSKAKKYGFRAAVATVTGSGVKDITVEFIKGSVRKWGRQKIGIFIAGSYAYVTSLMIPLITNSTKLIKGAKTVHTCIAYTVECFEDSANLVWLPLDLAIFGQPIPIGDSGRFNLLGDDLDFLN